MTLYLKKAIILYTCSPFPNDIMSIIFLQELVGHVIRQHCLGTSIHRTGSGVSEGDAAREEDTRSSPFKILDLCCGSGAIAVALLQECPQVH